MSADRAPWVIRHVPPVGRLFAGRRDGSAASVTEEFGEVWRTGGDAQPSGVPLIVVFSPRPALMAWIASSLAVALPAVVVVANAASSPRATVEAASVTCAALGANPGRLGIIGETDAAAAVIADCGAVGVPPAVNATRLALISPLLPAGSSLAAPVDGIPPCLLQFRHGSDTAGPIVEWERRLRATGVAVRSIDYRNLGDGWARYPRAVRGSQRGLDDLTGFFRRGFGVESTFGVIPGWDLH